MEGDYDPDYEYDAPMFVDFTTGVKDPNDSWFDNRGGDEGGFEIDSLEEDSEKELEKVEGEAATVVEAEQKPREPTPKIAPSEPENEPVSLPEEISKTEKEEQVAVVANEQQESHHVDVPERNVQALNQGDSHSPREDTEPPKKEESISETVKEQADSEPVKPSRPKNVLLYASWSKMLNPKPSVAAKPPSCEPPAKKARSTRSEGSPMVTRARLEAAKAPRRSHRLSRKRTESSCSTASSHSNASNISVFGGMPSQKVMPKIKKSMLTLPTTPTVLKRKHHPKTVAEPVKGNEEMELEEISRGQKELQNLRKRNDKYMKKALSGPSYKPVRSGDDPTEAVEFHFATDSRIKAQPNQNCSETKEKNFVETLRQHPRSPSFKNRGLTVPQPFSFDTDSRKRKHEDDTQEDPSEGYISMAQKCYSFQSKTPPRFRTKKAKEQNEGPPPCQKDRRSGSKLTCPKTPNLSTNQRKRPLASDILSREQEEERIAEEMKNYKFKAREFDPKIVEKQGNYGVKPLQAKALTEQQPFNLATNKRGEVYKQKETHEEEKAPVFKAQPIPEFKKIEFKPELSHQVTEPEPFSFANRDKEMMVKKEQKIKEIFEEEKKAREFKAQPLRSFSPVELPSTSKLQATMFEPFNLQTENRGAVKADKWIKMVQEEMQEERKKVAFKAHSSNVLYRPAFIPKKSQKPKTVFDDFELNSDRRAEERAIYEMHKHEKEAEEEALQRQREAEREEEERQNIAMLRKQLVHKHNPIRKYKTLEIVASDKPLTAPESPAWHTRERKNIRI